MFERRKKKVLLSIKILLLLVILLFIYARFIEPNIILIRKTEIEAGFKAKIIVMADLHLGAYKSVHFLERVVNKINEIKDADAILIPGDLTYLPETDLESMFYPLKDLKIPAYAVIGNHDSEKPGPPIQAELQRTLENNGIIFLQNTSADLQNLNITILGLGDNWANQDDISKIDNFSAADNLIVLTHNPDTTLNYKNSIPDLTITGHTHGGQIRVPFLYKKVIPCIGDFDKGLYETDHGKVFVASGLGETGLPMRFGIPPTIEILELK